MNAQEFTQICFLVLVLLSCIAWLAYSTDQYDKKVQALEKRLFDKTQLLAESNERNTQFRQEHWDRLRLAVNNRIGSEEGLFSATPSACAIDLACAEADRTGIGMVSVRGGVVYHVPFVDDINPPDQPSTAEVAAETREWREHDAAKIADGLIVASMERDQVRRAADGSAS